MEPIVVLARAEKNKWKTEIEQSLQPTEHLHTLRWFRGVPRRQLEIVPEQWRWPARSGRGENGNTLLNIHSPSVYHALVQKAKITDKGFFSPSSTLPAAQQEGSLKLIWCLDDVAPKTSALAWRITQRALPNADRWTGLLDMFELSTCHLCQAQPKMTSEHIFSNCKQALDIWDPVADWIS